MGFECDSLRDSFASRIFAVVLLCQIILDNNEISYDQLRISIDEERRHEHSIRVTAGVRKSTIY
ncbi:hypothetical protein [Microcoleus sp. CAWBG58]|uniref:hypothetical protein n=1 Tax=Microcoleus sp. CAWBG58 TaxID=2841651 RepID=UPI0025F55374|nr:hypothetical protein [Microcoleus sp. CAWBG58]